MNAPSQFTWTDRHFYILHFREGGAIFPYPVGWEFLPFPAYFEVNIPEIEKFSEDNE